MFRMHEPSGITMAWFLAPKLAWRNKNASRKVRREISYHTNLNSLAVLSSSEKFVSLYISRIRLSGQRYLS